MCPHRGPKEIASLTEGDKAKAAQFEKEIIAVDSQVSIYGPHTKSQENDACDSGFCWT
jgi:hypothetical protein